MEILSEIAKNLEHGDSAAVKELLRKALSMNIAPESILNFGLITGMEAVGKKFKANEIFIPEVLIASRAILEAYAITGSEPLESMARKAVAYTVKCQNSGMGWRYGRQPGDNDLSVTSWAVMSLLNARCCDIHVLAGVYRGADRFIRAMTIWETGKAGYATKGDSGARLSASRGFPPQEAMTAAAQSPAGIT